MKTSKQNELKSNHKESESEFMIKKSKIKKLVLLSFLMLALLAGCSTDKEAPVKEATPITQKQPTTDTPDTYTSKFGHVVDMGKIKAYQSIVQTNDFFKDNEISNDKNAAAFASKFVVFTREPVEYEFYSPKKLNDNILFDISTELLKNAEALDSWQTFYGGFNFDINEIDNMRTVVVIDVVSTDGVIDETNVLEKVIAPLFSLDDAAKVLVASRPGTLTKDQYNNMAEGVSSLQNNETDNAIQKSNTKF